MLIHLRNQLSDGQNLVEGDAVSYDVGWDDHKTELKQNKTNKTKLLWSASKALDVFHSLHFNVEFARKSQNRSARTAFHCGAGFSIWSPKTDLIAKAKMDAECREYCTCQLAPE